MIKVALSRGLLKVKLLLLIQYFRIILVPHFLRKLQLLYMYMYKLHVFIKCIFIVNQKVLYHQTSSYIMVQICSLNP